MDNRVPREWKDASYLSNKSMVGLVNDLGLRVEFFRGWVKSGEVPKTFWAGAFFDI